MINEKIMKSLERLNKNQKLILKLKKINYKNLKHNIMLISKIEKQFKIKHMQNFSKRNKKQKTIKNKVQ